MQYRRLSKNGPKVSAIGLGTGQFGTPAWGYGTRYDDSAIVSIVHTAIDNGINLFDTAETYANGRSESLLGKALEGYGRDEYVVVSKAAPWNLRDREMVKAVERSLSRLRVNAIDLYLIHYPNPFVPLKETIDAMKRLVRLGKIRYFGVSNFCEHLLKKADEFAEPDRIIADEIEYNVFSRRGESRTIPYCIRNDISIIAYSPLAGEMLTARYSATTLARGRARAFNFYNRKRFLQKCEPLFKFLRELAISKQVSVAQLALGYILRNQSFVAVPCALSRKEVIQNAEAASLTLTESEVRAIEDKSPTVGLPTYLFDHFLIRPISWTKAALSKPGSG